MQVMWKAHFGDTLILTSVNSQQQEPLLSHSPTMVLASRLQKHRTCHYEKVISHISYCDVFVSPKPFAGFSYGGVQRGG